MEHCSGDAAGQTPLKLEVEDVVKLGDYRISAAAGRGKTIPEWLLSCCKLSAQLRRVQGVTISISQGIQGKPGCLCQRPAAGVFA